jgi:ABC-type sugar transport system ATPase subunit
VALLPQDRHRFGLIALRPVRENVTYSVLDKITAALGIIPRSKERQITGEYIDKLGIVTPSQNQKTALLSGGNQQKVVFARLAATQPTVLILHEPSQGIDVRSKVDIFNIIDDLSAQGVAILIISTEVRELIGICDRILVMYDGRITHEFGKEDMEPHKILAAIEGGETNE